MKYKVIASAVSIMRVIRQAPTKVHVAIWYSILGLGVAMGVVVTAKETIIEDAANLDQTLTNGKVNQSQVYKFSKYC